MLIYVKSNPNRKSAYGLHKWVNDSSGKNVEKTKIGNATTTIQALYSGKAGGLANGLSYKPWLDDNGIQKVDSDGRKLTLQDKMEQKWGKPKGYLTNAPQKSNTTRVKEEDLTYFQKQTWILNDGTTVFDTDDFDGEMFYYMALDNKLIANSEKELRSHLWPKALFYIALENETEEILFQKNKAKSLAIASLHGEHMTPTMKEKFVSILNLTSTKSNLTHELVHNLLYDYINNSDHKPGSNLDKYNALVSSLETPDGRERIEARYLLKLAEDNKVVYEKQGAYIWPKADGQITLGENYTEAVDFILNPKKTALVNDLEDEIKLKSK